MPDPLSDPLAAELARLAPVPTAVTPAAVLFAAGQQAAEMKANRWRTATGAMALLFVASWIGMAMKPEATQRSSPAPQSYATDVTPKAPLPAAPRSDDTPLTPVKPIPQLVAIDKLTEEEMEARQKGIRLRRDILAGGLGMIPETSRADESRGPSRGWKDLNPAVLGGFYVPKKSED